MKDFFFKTGLILLCFFGSCDSKQNFNYTEDSKEYEEAVSLIEKNLPIFFPDSTPNNSISMYLIDFKKNNKYTKIERLMLKNSIEFININKDSNIGFFSNLNGSLVKKQYVLYFSRNSKEFIRNLPSDFKLVKQENENWLLVYRIVSLAN